MNLSIDHLAVVIMNVIGWIQVPSILAVRLEKEREKCRERNEERERESHKSNFFWV